MPVPEKSDDTVISLANLPASSRQRRLVLLVGVLVFIAFAALLPFANVELPEFSGFVPSSVALMVISDLITSILLYSQCSVAHSRSLLVLASGYLFMALIMIVHGLTFPGAFTPGGLLGAGPQTTPWLYFSSHFGSPAVLLAYARLKDVDRENPLRPSSGRRAIYISVAIAVACAGSLALVATVGSEYLPVILIDKTHAIRVRVLVIFGSIAVVAFIALVDLWIRRRSVLDYWLMLICVAMIQEQAIFSLTNERFTVGWYVGRSIWLITSMVVLVLLLQEMTRLYMRLARSYALLERQRDNKLLNAQAITASIAHEVRQPLMAIVASGGAALQYLKKTPPDHDKIRQYLNKMISETHRTSQVFDSIRSLFGRASQKREAVDVNEIVRDVLQSVGRELMDNGIVTSRELADLPPVECHRNQLQQVVYNLVQNALDAMQTVPDRKRALGVRTERRGETAIAVVIEDTGPGIDPSQVDRIFSAFVTTKPHGMGLGLAICRQILEHHGGELVASSDGVSGAQFEVVLPVRPARAS